MKLITTYRKVTDVEQIKGKKVDSMTGKVYVIGTSRGVCRFTESLAIYHAIVARNKVITTNTHANKAEKALEYEIAAKAVRTVENAYKAVSEAAKLAEEAANVEQTEEAASAVEFAQERLAKAEENLARAKAALERFKASEEIVDDLASQTVASELATSEPAASEPVETASQSMSFDNPFECLVKVDEEWYVRLSDTRMISFAAFTREDGKAVVGETPLGRKSPADYKAIAANVAAEIPTAEDFEKFEEVVQNLIKILNEIFRNEVNFTNQLIVTSDGYRTYLGEYKHLLEKFPVYNLASRKVIKG